MTAFVGIGALLAACLFVYLVWALLCAEDF